MLSHVSHANLPVDVVGPIEAPGCTALGRFTRLELIDAEADAAVFGDANLSC